MDYGINEQLLGFAQSVSKLNFNKSRLHFAVKSTIWKRKEYSKPIKT